MQWKQKNSLVDTMPDSKKNPLISPHLPCDDVKRKWLSHGLTDYKWPLTVWGRFSLTTTYMERTQGNIPQVTVWSFPSTGLS